MKNNSSLKARIPLFKKMDDAIAKGVTAFQGHSLYSQAIGLFSNIDDNIKKILEQIIGLAIIFSPLVICLIFLGINTYKKFNLDTKKEILKISYHYSSKKIGLGNSSQKLISKKEISDQGQLLNVVKRDASASSTTSATFSIQSFDQADETEHITRTNARIIFKEMTLANLMRAVKTLSERSLIRTVNIQIAKGDKKQLSGFFDILYYAEVLDKSVPDDGEVDEEKSESKEDRAPQRKRMRNIDGAKKT